MKAYFIPGLGADHRVFHHLKLPGSYEIIHLPWTTPKPEDTLASYASRMAEQVDSSAPFILLGLSMGGMIACEMARIKPPAKLILISSIPRSQDLPFYFRIAASVKAHRWMPLSLFTSASIAKRFFTAEEPGDKQLLKQMIRDCDPVFLRWAITAIVKWKQEDLPANYLHLHGSVDRLLPLRYTRPTHIIQKGGHVMLLEQFDEINRILAEYL